MGVRCVIVLYDDRKLSMGERGDIGCILHGVRELAKEKNDQNTVPVEEVYTSDDANLPENVGTESGKAL